MTDLTDQQFFTAFRDRKARIRLPKLERYVNKQRAVQYLEEEEVAFRSLGPHNKDRRRILVYRVPVTNPLFGELQKRMKGTPLLKIPFLLFADESVENRDDVLLPIIDKIMREAAQR